METIRYVVDVEKHGYMTGKVLIDAENEEAAQALVDEMIADGTLTTTDARIVWHMEDYEYEDGTFEANEVSDTVEWSGCVDVVASGYEWECPICETLNTMCDYPATQKLTCSHCASEFDAELPEHCID